MTVPTIRVLVTQIRIGREAAGAGVAVNAGFVGGVGNRGSLGVGACAQGGHRR
jgi:hypothetical protein